MMVTRVTAVNVSLLLPNWYLLLFITSLHYRTIHIPEVIHLNYLSHLPIIYVASTFCEGSDTSVNLVRCRINQCKSQSKS